MNDNLITIIVPIYNKENVIEKCIESIKNQTFKNIEVLLINDGSTDNSKVICERFEKSDNRIRLINKENGGVSSARNLGITKAQGKYIQFVDADDYLESNMCEVLINTIVEQNSDIVICGFNTYSNENVEITNCINKNVSNLYELGEDFSSLYIKFIFHNPWNKLFKKELINIMFDENMSLGEDLIFNMDNIKYAKRISFINERLYNYIKYDNNSLTSQYREDGFDNAIYLYEKVKSKCVEVKIDEKHSSGVDTVLINTVLGCIGNLIINSYKENHEIKTIIKKWINNYHVQVASNFYKANKINEKILNHLIRFKRIKLICLYYKFKKVILKL